MNIDVVVMDMDSGRDIAMVIDVPVALGTTDPEQVHAAVAQQLSRTDWVWWECHSRQGQPEAWSSSEL